MLWCRLVWGFCRKRGARARADRADRAESAEGKPLQRVACAHTKLACDSNAGRRMR